jgi:2-hydroxychromene-2-carboxylate isomerase
MAAPIEFLFEFASPYSYIAAHRIDAMAAQHGRQVNWRPFLLGVVARELGTIPLTAQKKKGNYSAMDFARSARQHGLTFALQPGFPHSSVQAARAFYWLESRDPDLAKRFARRVFDAYHAEGRDMSAAESVADLAAEAGADRHAVLAGIAEPAIKDRLKRETDRAAERDVFGAPFFFVDGEPFWGNDRIEQIDEWLRRGGW